MASSKSLENRKIEVLIMSSRMVTSIMFIDMPSLLNNCTVKKTHKIARMTSSVQNDRRYETNYERPKALHEKNISVTMNFNEMKIDPQQKLYIFGITKSLQEAHQSFLR